MFIGIGSLINVLAIVIGTLLGWAVGSRLREATRTLTTQVLGLCTLVLGALSIRPLLTPPLAQAVPAGAVFVVIIVSLALGAVIGSASRLEDRCADLGSWLRRKLVRGDGKDGEHGFVDAFVTATLVFGVGPMSILGAVQEGLGQGPTTLFMKSVLDLVAAMAFASAMGMGVMASALVIGLYQGTWTLLAFVVGDLLPAVQVDMISVIGGIILLGLGLRLVGAAEVRVADLLPALVVGPLLLAGTGLL